MIYFNNVVKKISTDFQLKINKLAFYPDKNYKIYGQNGSGKTVFLKLLLGLIIKDSGSLKKTDSSFSGFLGIERMVDFLTPREYFYIVCKSYAIKKSEVSKRFNYLNSFFNRKYMDEKKLICDYSDGNRQLIGIMAACLPYSNFIVLDEPFNYLDDITAMAMVKMLNSLHKEKSISIIYSDNVNRVNLEDFENIYIENGLVIQKSDE